MNIQAILDDPREREWLRRMSVLAGLMLLLLFFAIASMWHDRPGKQQMSSVPRTAKIVAVRGRTAHPAAYVSAPAKVQPKLNALDVALAKGTYNTLTTAKPTTIFTDSLSGDWLWDDTTTVSPTQEVGAWPPGKVDCAVSIAHTQGATGVLWRTEPNRKAKVIRTLRSGEEFECLGPAVDAWIEVTDGVQTGWITSRYALQARFECENGCVRVGSIYPNNLLVRASPGGSLVGWVSQGALLELTGESAHIDGLDWVGVYYGGESSWVAAKFTEPIK